MDFADASHWLELGIGQAELADQLSAWGRPASIVFALPMHLVIFFKRLDSLRPSVSLKNLTLLPWVPLACCRRLVASLGGPLWFSKYRKTKGRQYVSEIT